MKKLFVKGIMGPFAIVIGINLMSFIHPLPVIVQMIVSAIVLAYIGCILSVPIQSTKYKDIQYRDQEYRKQRQKSSFLSKCWEIGVYPLTATITILLLYFLVKNIQQMTKEVILNIIFMVLSSYCCIKYSHYYALKFVKKCLDAANIDSKIASSVHFLLINIIFPLLCTLPAILEVITKHWFIDNLYGIAFTLLAIKEANIKSFKIAIPILWLLFIYDLYWVYESDVMVTVAKNIDLPLKLKFPYLEETNENRFSMLGLGDIVLPGMLISLCIKYDIDSCILSWKFPKKVQDFRYPLFYSMLFAYGLSLIVTYLALFYFKHPQPALVFIVPFCSLALFVFARFRKNQKVWQYNSKNLSRKNTGQVEEQMENVI